MAPDLQQAKKFLQFLTGGTLATFQTFNDGKEKKAGCINRIMHGLSDINMKKLAELNAKNSGVFVMVNLGDGKGRKAENVEEVRAIFADFDGAPLPEAWDLLPHIVVESSPGRYHAYWLVNDCPLDGFKSVQQKIALKYKADPSVCDLPRVMRIPGFYHNKKEPFMSRIIGLNDVPPYMLQNIIDSLGLKEFTDQEPSKGVNAAKSFMDGSTEGGRTSVIVRTARSVSRYGYSEDDAIKFCLALDLCSNKPPLESTHPGKVESTVRNVYERYVYSDTPEFVTELNEDYFVASEGGKTLVCKESYDHQLERAVIIRSTFADFKKLHDHKKVLIGKAKDGTPSFGPRGSSWLDSQYRRQYESIVMAPNKDVPGCYNLWKGFNVKPVKGCWEKMKEHICNVICAGDQALYEYVICWVARMVQFPGSPGEVALVLQGGRGTGKGCFGHSLLRICGQHGCHVANGKHVTGKFNAHLEDCIFLFVDEAIWAGDKEGENILKSLITERILSVERKFVDMKQASNMLHILMASNNDWVVPAGYDERRYCVLKVSDAQAGNHSYFDALMHETRTGGLEAMLYDLLELDITNFNVRDVPKTQGLLEQKIHSMDPTEAWWFQKLQDGETLDGYGWGPVPTKALLDDYVQTTLKVSAHLRRSYETVLGMKLRKLLPGGLKKKKKMGVAFYTFPPLKDCRAFFEGVIGVALEWEGLYPELKGIPSKGNGCL